MKPRSSVWTGPLASTLAVALFAVPAAGQSRSVAPHKWTAPRTPDGHPDLQGIWSNATITPFERPSELAGKEFLTEQEAADYEKTFAREINRDQRSSDAAADLKGSYN